MTTFRKVWRVGLRFEAGSNGSRSAEVKKLSDYLRISEAAEYLGISPNTFRNWVDGGKVVAIRHPVNDYRLFQRADLDALLKQVAVASKRAVR